jgi:hypothetical protein
MSNTKFRIVKYNGSFEELGILQVCHSYKEADDRFDYWDEKYTNDYIEILTPEDWRNLQLGSNPLGSNPSLMFQTSYTITGQLQRQLAAVATPIVENWFTDVLIHDTAAILNMEIGEVRLWSLRQGGTWLYTLKQSISEHNEFCGLITKIMKRPDEYNDGYYHLFLIHKISADKLKITPTNYEEMSYVNV